MIAQKQMYKTVARSRDLIKTKLPHYSDNSHKEKKKKSKNIRSKAIQTGHMKHAQNYVSNKNISRSIL